MTIENRGNAKVVTHALARHTLSDLRSVETEQVAFRKGLVKLGRICGYEIINDQLGTEAITVRTPLAETSGECVTGMENIVIVNILRAATPLVEGLLKAFPSARQGIISAARNEEAGRKPDGTFPIGVEYVKLPEINAADTVIVADPMLATGSTMCAVLDAVLGREEAVDPKHLFVLSAVSAPEGLERIDARFPQAELLTVAVDDHLDENGFIVPGLGDAGDRAFGTRPE